jgi:crotonobetainyl-CoA:carnitine CoA-transferase CaiB-like acyl-CoA transferase
MAQKNSTELIQKLNAQKIPAGFIQNMKEVFEMAATKKILMEDAGVTGVRSYVAKSQSHAYFGLLPPPHLGEHTSEIVDSLR